MLVVDGGVFKAIFPPTVQRCRHSAALRLPGARGMHGPINSLSLAPR